MKTAIALLCFLIFVGPAQAMTHPFKSLYGDEIRFNVLRDNRTVGEYRTRFNATRDGWEARVEMSVSLRMMLLFSYEYRYYALERWQDGELAELSVLVDEDGDQHRLHLQRKNDRLTTAPLSDHFTYRPIQLPIFTTHHFDPRVIGQERILNTLTGKENQVEMIHEGETELMIAGKAVPCDRYRYEGDLRNTEVWYAKTGQWLKLRFPDKRGATIELECVACGISTDG